MRKLMTLALALVMTLGAFAQNSVLNNGKRSFESFTPSKHQVSQSKAMSVDIEIGEIGPLEVEVTVTPNEEVAEWHYLAGCTSDPNSTLSQYLALLSGFGYTLEEAIMTFSDNEMEPMVGTQTVVMGYMGWMQPGVVNTVYVVAVDAQGNVQLFTEDFTAGVLGGEGPAEITVNLPADSVTAESYYGEFTPNDQTARWHYIMLDETTRAAYSWTDDSVMAHIGTFDYLPEGVSGGAMLLGVAQTLYGDPGETYHWYAVAYNVNDEASDLVYASVTLDALGGHGEANVNVVVSNVTGFEADIVMTPNDQTAYFYYSIISDEEMQAAGIADDAAMKAYLEANSQKNFFEVGGTLSGLTSGTTYKVYAFAYNLDDVCSYTAPVTTFTTETLGGTGLAEVEVLVEVVDGVVSIETFKNDQTAFMYFAVYQQIADYTDEELFQSLLADPNNMATDDLAGDIQLEDGVEYGVFVMPFNGANEQGTPVAIRFTSEGLVGLADVEASSLSLYPNPANTQVTVSSQSAIDRVEIVNMLGQKVYENANVGGNQATINVAGLENGTYIIRIVSAKSNKSSKLIVR